jgi:hypothetical protein
LRKVSLTLPLIAEQEAIAAMLVALDDTIEVNRRMKTIAREMVASVKANTTIDWTVKANVHRTTNRRSP